MDKLNDTDIRILEKEIRPTSRMFRIVAFALPLVLLLSAASHLHLASKFAKSEGVGLGHYVQTWLEPQPSAQYSGTTLMAVKRVDMAFYTLLLSGLFGALNMSTLRHRRRLGGVLQKLKPLRGWDSYGIPDAHGERK